MYILNIPSAIKKITINELKDFNSKTVTDKLDFLNKTVNIPLDIRSKKICYCS